MQEITILSGKGGTGKTSITAALISLAKNAVFCDNDVDAADLHLILKPEVKEEHTFDSGWFVFINEHKCNNCGICIDYCRFNAIHYIGEKIEINPFQCEGCRLCERICPIQAISSIKNTNNYWYVSKTRFGTLVHAKMGPGEENSGKLVTQIRKKTAEIARSTNADFLINDGPPGIGCPVIASLTGTNIVLIVIEPSLSALHDAQRLVELMQSFNVKMYAVINKYDINKEIAQNIEEYLHNYSIPLIGTIPFHEDFVKAMIDEKTIIEYSPEIEITAIINNIWKIITSK